MKPVHQTKFGYGNGNCLQACVASILECDIDNVPNFSDSYNWFSLLVNWCTDKGLGLLYLEKEIPNSLFVNCHLILTLEIANSDELHAVVGKSIVNKKHDPKFRWEAEVVFDPNPNKNEFGDLKGIILIFNQKLGN